MIYAISISRNNYDNVLEYMESRIDIVFRVFLMICDKYCVSGEGPSRPKKPFDGIRPRRQVLDRLHLILSSFEV